MRRLFSLIGLVVLIGCSESVSEIEPHLGRSDTARANPPTVSGDVYCTPAEIADFTGTALRLEDGRFEYWFYSDVEVVGAGDEPDYPLVGGYASKNGVLSLTHDEVLQRKWHQDAINGIDVLLREDAKIQWKETGRLYDYGILIRVANPRSFGDSMQRPSIRVLYSDEMQQRIKKWGDPFVNGAQ